MNTKTTLKITIDSHVHHYIQYATELNYYHNNLFSTIPESGGGRSSSGPQRAAGGGRLMIRRVSVTLYVYM